MKHWRFVVENKKKKEPQISFKLTAEEDELKRIFVSRISREGLKIKGVVLGFIRDYIEGASTGKHTPVRYSTENHQEYPSSDFQKEHLQFERFLRFGKQIDIERVLGLIQNVGSSDTEQTRSTGTAGKITPARGPTKRPVKGG